MSQSSIDVKDLLISLDIYSKDLIEIEKEKTKLLANVFEPIPELAKDIRSKGLPKTIVLAQNLSPFADVLLKFCEKVIINQLLGDGKILLFWFPLLQFHKN